MDIEPPSFADIITKRMDKYKEIKRDAVLLGYMYDTIRVLHMKHNGSFHTITKSEILRTLKQVMNNGNS